MAQDTAPENTTLTSAAAPPPEPEVPSAFNLFKPSWEGLKLNIIELIVIYLVPYLVAAALVVLAVIGSVASFHNDLTALGILLIVLAVLIILGTISLVGPAIVHLQLKSARMEKASYESAWTASKTYWWRFLVLSFCVALTILVGFLLLIVPGVIFLRRYFLSQYALVDQDLSVGDSMRTSSQLSKGRSMAIFGLIGVEILISLTGVIPVMGGVVSFVLTLVYFCAPAIRYEQLKGLKPKA